ncbi:MAG: hypothetical protein CL748_01090 [Chloroflexi bacterium]|nr:hypothetical protein [Chloroflexota bacterium]
MPKINQYSYPEYPLESSIIVIKDIYNNFAGEVSRSALASLMSMSERGGAFTDRLASLKIWKLLEGKSKLRVTADAVNIITSSNPNEIIADLILRIPLFNEISSRVNILGGSYTKEQIKIIISDISSASIDDYDSKLNHIYTIFDQISSYVCSKNITSQNLKTSLKDAKLKVQFNDLTIESELNISNIDTALISLWSKRSELEVNTGSSKISPIEIIIRNKINI